MLHHKPGQKFSSVCDLRGSSPCISSFQSCHCKPLSFLSPLMHGCPLHPQANYSINDTGQSSVPGLIIGSELSERRKRWFGLFIGRRKKSYSFEKEKKNSYLMLNGLLVLNKAVIDADRYKCFDRVCGKRTAHTLWLSNSKGKWFIMEALQRNPPYKQAQKMSSSLICQGTWRYWLNHIIQSINFHGTENCSQFAH